MRPAGNLHQTHKNLINPPTWYKQSHRQSAFVQLLFTHLPPMPTPRLSGAGHIQQAPASPKYMLAEEARQRTYKKEKNRHQANDELQTLPISTFSEVFSCFPFSFKTAENNAIKRNIKSRLRKKSSIKENLLCMRRQDLLKPIRNRPSQKLSALICFALQEILKLTAHYSISFLNCQK